jgi:hypothetical protein
MTDAAHQKDEDAEAEISNSFKRHQYKVLILENSYPMEGRKQCKI